MYAWNQALIHGLHKNIEQVAVVAWIFDDMSDNVISQSASLALRELFLGAETSVACTKSTERGLEPRELVVWVWRLVGIPAA